MPRFLHSNPIRTMFVLLFWFAMVLLRVAHLDSDAYARLSWSSALLTDEGFYIHNARNLLLFGQMRTDDFNNALIMPLLHCLQVAVFTLCGVGAIQARMISVTTGLLSLLVFFAAMRRAYGLRVAWLTLALLGLDPVFALYNRLALMDTPACLPLCCAFYAWTCHREEEEKRRQYDAHGLEQNLFATQAERAGNAHKDDKTENGKFTIAPSPFVPLLFCGLSLGAAYAMRGLAAIVVPVPVLLLLKQAYVARQHGEGGIDNRKYIRLMPLLAFGVGLTLALLPYLLLWYVPHHQEIARANVYYVREQLLPHNGREWMRNLQRGLFDWQRGMMPYLLKHSPVLLLASVLRAWRKRGRQQEGRGKSSSEWYLWGWLLFIAALTLSVNYAPSRYYVLFYPPLAGLAALRLNQFTDRSLDQAVYRVKPLRFYTSQHLFWLSVLGWIIGNGGWYADWLLHVSYRQRNADQWLAANLPPGSVLIGAVAPGLSLDNRFRCVNVIEGLCNDVNPVEKAAPAPRYILILDRHTIAGAQYEPALVPNPATLWADRWKEPYWRRAYPDLVRPERRLKAFPHLLRPFFTIGVYPVPANYSSQQHSMGTKRAR